MRVAVESFSTRDQAGAALLQIEFMDENSNYVPIPNWKKKSRRVGDYYYLTPGDQKSPTLDEFELVAPPLSRSLRISGKQWKIEVLTGVVGEISLDILGSSSIATELASGTPLKYSATNLNFSSTVPMGSDAVSVRVRHVSGDQGTVCPLSVEFTGANGKALMPSSDLAQNPVVGPSIVLEAKANTEVVHEVSLSVPRGASEIHLQGHDRGSKTANLIGAIQLDFSSVSNDSVGRFFDSLGEYDNVFVIDTTAPPLGHQSLALRPNNLSAAYSRQGIPVVFVPFGSLQEHDAFVSDQLIQVGRNEFDLMLDRVAEVVRRGAGTYICSSFPSLQAVAAATYLKARGWNVVYEVRDDMEEFNRVGYSKWYSPALEREMLRIADPVISVSKALDDKLAALIPIAAPRHIIPNAVNSAVIENGRSLRSVELLGARSTKNIVGYVGHLTAAWFDWPAVVAAAHRMPEVKFEIVGHGKPATVELPDNVSYLGPKSHDELVEIVEHWKVGLIPFVDQPLTHSVDPNKIYEYFAWGLRCVTAPMGMVDEYPSTWVYRGIDSFCNAIKSALEEPMDESELARLEQFLQTATWDYRAAQMIDAMGLETQALEGDGNA